MARTIRYSLIAVGALTAVLLAGVCWLLWPALTDLAERVESRMGHLARVTETASYRIGDDQLIDLDLTSTTGIRFRMTIRRPADSVPGDPVMLLMAGQETGQAAVDYIDDTYGVTVAAISYPFGVIPHRDRLALLKSVRQIQRGILDTPAAVLLAIEYLDRFTRFAPERIELAGVSFGAVLAPMPAALDERIDRVWLIHGAGDPAGVIAANLDRLVPIESLQDDVARFLATAVAERHLRPERWVGAIAPRPVVVVSARDDRQIPMSAIRSLHDALQPPYEIVWTEGGHVHPKRPDTIRQITELMFQRFE